MNHVDHVDLLERTCADAWPAMVDEPLGEWRLRAAGGFTGRANSALTLGDPGVPMADALTAVRGFAADNGIPATAHVVVGSPVESALAAADWAVNTHHPGGGEAVVMTGPLAGLVGAVPTGMTGPDRAPDDWWPLAVGAASPTPAQVRVLGGGEQVGFGTARDEHGAVIGIVRGAVVGDLLHIARLAITPAHRRHGLATGLLAALADWGIGRGAGRCALQVAVPNHGAIALYAKLGCRRHHGYRYWVPA
jgi:ribosomal protein S18 acetylase RimI-like enzyme